MSIPRAWQVVAVAALLISVSACSKKTTAPVVQTPAPASTPVEYRYYLGSFFADSGYTVKSLEYADANGVIQKASYQNPMWLQKVDLKPGDRMYVRAEVSYESILGGGIQIVADAPSFYASDHVELFDGPKTVVLVVDQIVK